jgi:hypothetical protein
MRLKSMSRHNRPSCRGYKPVEGQPWPWDTDRLRGKDAPERMATAEALAKSICAGCPLKGTCLALGKDQDLTTLEPNGIYGGLNPEERAAELGATIVWMSGARRLVQL